MPRTYLIFGDIEGKLDVLRRRINIARAELVDRVCF
jgi:hypothetical protein